MLHLVLDGKNSTVQLVDGENRNQPEVVNGEDFKAMFTYENWGQEKFFHSIFLSNVDFEGFVITLVDGNGNTFTAEVPGLHNAKERPPRQ